MIRPNLNHHRHASLTLENITDLSAIRARRVLVLLDEQNLSISARNLGWELDYRLLAELIRSTARGAELHLFTAADAHDHHTARRFQQLGYVAHVKTIRHVYLPGGRHRSDSNVDNLFSFRAGLLTARTTCETVVLGSGDYGLAGELAGAITDRDTDRTLAITTLSLPGSTARDLDARKNPFITANLEIGLDVLKSLSPSIDLPGVSTAGSSRAFRW